MTPDTHDSNYDANVAQRLGKLSALPVDTSAMDGALRPQIGQPPAVRSWQRALRPLSAAAAGLILIALVGLLFLQGRTAHAEDVAQLHRDILSGKVKTVLVSSLAEVHSTFEASKCDMPKMSSTGGAAPSCCCVATLCGKDIPCVLLNCEGTSVSLTFTQPGLVRTSDARAVTRNGKNFHVYSNNGVNVVMFTNGDHQLCITSTLAPERLMTLADGLGF